MGGIIMEEVFVSVATQILSVLIPVLVALVLAWLKQKLGVEKLQKIQEELFTKKELALLAVKFVQQAYSDLSGPEKYTKAAEWLADQTLKIGLKLDVDDIKGLIEAAIREAKDALGEEWSITKTA
jgi:LL-H family phage holin